MPESTLSQWGAVLASGGIGASAALLGQYLAGRFAANRHRLEIAQREREFLSSFALPLAQTRVGAFEEMYELLQKAIDESGLTDTDYVRVRRLLIYLPDDLRTGILRTLTGFLSAVASGQTAVIQSRIGEIRRCQLDLREALGLSSVESLLDSLRHSISRQTDQS